MRFNLGPPPTDPLFQPAPPWRTLREPTRTSIVVLLSVPLGLLAASLFALPLLLRSPDRTLTVPLSGLPSLLALLLLVPLHELLHALPLPGSLRSPQLVLGFWPRTLLAYVHYHGELTRARFLVVALSPLVTVSLLAQAGSLLLPTLDPFWLTLGLLNALGSGADLLAAALVLAQVPRDARLRNHGWRTHWRPAEHPHADRPTPPGS
ncbi:DUF3267 domain-containing protein [Thermomicrobium sp.]